MYIRPTAPLPVHKIVGQIASLFVATFLKALPYSFAGNLLFVLGLAGAYVMKPDEEGSGDHLWLWIMLLTILAYPSLMSAVLVRVDAGVEQRSVRFWEPLARAAACFFPCLAVCVAYLAIVGIGCVLLIVPGMFLALNLGFWWPAMVLDGHRVASALPASARLLWGRWWRAAGGLMFILTAYGISTALERATDKWADEPIQNLAAFSLGWLGMTALSIFSCCAVVVTHHDLKMRAARNAADA